MIHLSSILAKTKQQQQKKEEKEENRQCGDVKCVGAE